MTIQSSAKESIEVVTKLAARVPADLEDRLPALNELYFDLHKHPELSMQEHRTAEILARHLRNAGYEVTEGVGHTGVVGLLAQWSRTSCDASRRHGCTSHKRADWIRLREQGNWNVVGWNLSANYARLRS